MNEPDFSGINPLRVPTARARLAAIIEYLDIPDRTVADAIRISKSVDLSRWSFQRLVKVWTLYKRVELLVENKKDRSTKKLSLSDSVRSMLAEEIKKAGPEASLKNLYKIMVQRCAENGLKAPSYPMIQYCLQRARAENPGMVGGPPRIVIGRLSFHLPVKEGDRDDVANPLPQALVAVALPECIVLHHQISVEADLPPSIERLVHDVLSGQTAGSEPRSLLLMPIDLQLTLPVFQEFGIKRIGRNTLSTQRELSRAFGERFGTLTPIYHPNHAKPGRRLVLTRQDQPLSQIEAVAAIESAIATNNLSRTMASPKYVIKTEN